ncbi:GNAT family N-acetyltransferase [Vagococcus carniphilus]|uniref:GNAT family N-acetyltransferase n=1 Tax=Vagococcus carniphilus TaxID=218144 RepID=A0AAW8U4H1_9ENTE|nr:GNAT family N-acetyltransferase [Vagococcus carniphilus]MDT2815498.1 GNAT family N-acetyltransferase [Vagococcus carniphilus]MDT2829540.1 GNAT family N-acetyltransferase [Vagococcus carniphilus]MDT2833119.1 GNAT family N-acetyltransferase [Vagococcus carniphilus]MDT2838999.1 GNAT family N-acetyltransferase [Vagococcus carniphilus]MDT2853057.1 GNAT family N-acetyltransferase [Vagococcus carniphilus]
MKFEKTFQPKEEDIKQLRQLLSTYNQANFETDEFEEFAIYAKEDGEIIGGINGEIFGQWMDIEYLVIEEPFRDQHLGSSLLEQAEALAKEKNCRYIFLTTFGFQGKDYYPKFGFSEVYFRKNFPMTGTEHYFIKEL